MDVRQTGQAAQAAQPRSRPVRLESCVATKGDSQIFSDAKTVIPVFNTSGASLLLTFKSWSDLHFQRAADRVSAIFPGCLVLGVYPGFFDTLRPTLEFGATRMIGLCLRSCRADKSGPLHLIHPPGCATIF